MMGFRLVGYIFGVFLAGGMGIFVFLRNPHVLAKMMGSLLIVLALFMASFGIPLYIKMTGAPTPNSMDGIWTISVWLMNGALVALYIVYNRATKNGDL